MDEGLLTRDHSLNGGILFGLEGYTTKIQARAMKVSSKPEAWRSAVWISGMARGAIPSPFRGGVFAQTLKRQPRCGYPPLPTLVMVMLLTPVKLATVIVDSPALTSWTTSPAFRLPRNVPAIWVPAT
jgi:hypothetical protein